MVNMAPKSESDRHATQKEAKCSIAIQNHTFEVAIVIVMFSWQFSLYSGKKEAIGKVIANFHSPSLSVFEFKWYECASIYVR